MDAGAAFRAISPPEAPRAVPDRLEFAVPRAFAPLLVALLAATACPPADTAPPDEPAPAALPRLHAEGRLLVDAEGAPVQLRGVNLGAWHFHESWISGVDYAVWGRARQLGIEAGLQDEVDAALIAVGAGDDADWLAGPFRDALAAEAGGEAADALVADAALYPSLRDDSDLPMRLQLEGRFGTDGRDALLDAFARAWITDADLAWLASQGFNLVRVPLGYRALLENSDAEPLQELRWNERSWDRIQWLLDACEAHGIYAVVDLQESPGGHNDYSGEAHLYDDPAMQELTLELWGELVDRFGDEPAVAAWSLLAEPFSAPSSEARDAMYDRLHDQIRAAGDDHLLVIHDGFQGMWDLPDPADMGWTGVVYSTHLFEWGADSREDYDALTEVWRTLLGGAQEGQGVPYFIGSWSVMEDADWAYESAGAMVSLFEELRWPWSLWTMKRLDDPWEVELFGAQTSWGLLGRQESAFDRPDLYRDPYEELERKFAAYEDLELAPNDALLEAITGGW
jgi:aryl-phospho-beta-D-glucosidase BglC (GH1 family)